jgi:hypothetical protein
MTVRPTTLIVTTTPDRMVSHCGASVWGAGTHLVVTAAEFSIHGRVGTAPYNTVRLVVPDDHLENMVRQLAWGATVKRNSHHDPRAHGHSQAAWLRRLADEVEARDADTMPDAIERDDDREDEPCPTP